MIELEHLADRLQAELRALGAWENDPTRIPPPRGAFGSENVPFEHWLQVVLLERLREVARGKAELPARSMLVAKAVREFDGERARYDGLLEILQAIDDAVECRVTEAAR
jgi:uncharacterized protein YqcC (DUF446 family)